MNKLFIVLIILIFGYGAYQWQNNIYSKEILKLEILGPTETKLSQEIEYVVKYKNNGDFRLENPELIFEAPENSLQDGEFFEMQILNSEKLGGAIYPGEEKNFSFKVRLLGREGDIKIAKASLSYKPKNLNARYESSSSFSTQIKSAPLVLGFDLPSNVSGDNNFDFKLNYFSNLDYPLTDLRCQIDYPSGFEFVRSSPSALEKTDWIIPVLNKSEGGGIEITGSLSGNVGEAKIFKAKIGMWKDNRFVILREIERGVEITEPSLYIRQEINNNPQYIASSGELLHYEIFFKNVGDEGLTNLFMVSQFEDSILDFGTMNSNSGDYQPGDNSIIFDWNKNPKLQYLSPLEEGKVEFWIRVKDDLANIKNPIIKSNIFIGQTKQSFITKVNSKLVVEQKGFFENDIFENSGPIPPKVGKETTYIIVWTPKSYYSDVENVKVRALLPNNVELTGEVFPEGELSNFTFDSQTREIIWSVGNLKKGILGSTIVFQVKLTPNSSQRGSAATLVDQVIITGYDAWTESNLSSSSIFINTSLPDPSSEDDGIIQ